MNLMTSHPVEIAHLTVSDLAIVALMVVVFVLALLLPYPRAKDGRRP
jgi:hypothetical protein